MATSFLRAWIASLRREFTTLKKQLALSGLG